jgi:serine protease
MGIQSDSYLQFCFLFVPPCTGTHVAGTIAAATGNGLGVRGVGVFDLVIVRALSDEASGYESDIYMAVQQCIEMGADVINLSLGSTLMSDFAKDLYTTTVEDDDIIMVAAAGNNGDETRNYPASHPSVISVGAIDQSGKRLSSSVRNDQIELVAPGNEIISTSVARYAVKTSDFSFTAERVVGPPDEARTGKLSLCDFYSDDPCTVEEDGICLFKGGVVDVVDATPDEALARCAAAGGAGAVFFVDDDGILKIPKWYIRNGDIPAVCISKESGIDLLKKLDDDDDNVMVTIGDEDDDNIEYTYDILSGTSMAAPHVAASAALLKSHFYSCSASQIRYALAYTAQHPSDGCNEEYGYGVIKVKDAYDWIDKQDGCTGWDVKSISRGGCTTVDSN